MQIENEVRTAGCSPGNKRALKCGQLRGEARPLAGRFGTTCVLFSHLHREAVSLAAPLAAPLTCWHFN
jgi:hypothetical protein